MKWNNFFVIFLSIELNFWHFFVNFFIHCFFHKKKVKFHIWKKWIQTLELRRGTSNRRSTPKLCGQFCLLPQLFTKSSLFRWISTNTTKQSLERAPAFWRSLYSYLQWFRALETFSIISGLFLILAKKFFTAPAAQQR